MTVHELCKKIDLQESVAARVNAFVSSYNFSGIDTILQELLFPETAKEAYEKLEAAFPKDEDKIKMLSCWSHFNNTILGQSCHCLF